MREFDGLKLLVQFYENHGQLNLVSEKTGVPVTKIKEWLNGGTLSTGDRGRLGKDIDPRFTGKILIG